MSSLESNSSANVTLVRPASFFLNGLSNAPHAKYYYVFLSLVYGVTILANLFIMCVIFLSRRLHTAKYVVVFNLAVCDLCGSSSFIPKIIDAFLLEHQGISYEVCMANMFFVYHFMNMQSLTLVVLAYDRLVAICFPLRYHAIVTKPAMFLIIVVLWIFSVICITVLVGMVGRLSFCRSNVIDSYFCDHSLVCKLACNDTTINVLMVKIHFGLLVCAPLLMIFISYFSIARALFKIAHGADRKKAIKTCTSHLMLVAIFYIPFLANQITIITAPIDVNVRIINSSLTQAIPPMLNPIIYTLKTEEIMQSIKELYKRSTVNTTERMKCKRKNPKG